MATAPKAEALQSVLAIDPATIEIGPRIGLFWPDKAAALGKLMSVDGQRTPITVRRNSAKAKLPWLLVTGFHRVQGALLEEFRSIDAIEVFGDDAGLRDMEASENLHRRSFGPIERACFVRAIADAAEQRMQAQHEGMSQQQIAVKARWYAAKAKAKGVVRDDELAQLEAEHTTANLAGVYQWNADVAAALGMSLRSVERDLALHRAIIAPFPDLYRSLAGHPEVGENASALREIAAVRDEAARGKLIAALLDNPEWKVAQAKEAMGMRDAAPAPATGATKFMNNAAQNVARLSLEQQRSWAPTFAQSVKPQALRAMADAIAARIEELGV